MINELVSFRRLDHAVESEYTAEFRIVEDNQVLMLSLRLVQDPLHTKARMEARMKRFLEPVLQHKAMRRWLIDTSDNLISNGHLLLVGGPTGAAKTRLLNEGNAGKPIPGSIDLEGLANHRGSAFGRRVTEQPTQISFELAFGAQLVKHRCHGHQTLILEDEGRLIGRCALPLALQSARGDADWVQLDASIEARVQHSYENYILKNLEELLVQDAAGGFDHFASGLLESLERIQKRLGGERFDALRSTMLEALASHERGTPEMHKTWIRQLLTDYYDPMYEYQMNKRNRPPVFRGNEGDVSEYLLHVAQRDG